MKNFCCSTNSFGAFCMHKCFLLRSQHSHSRLRLLVRAASSESHYKYLMIKKSFEDSTWIGGRGTNGTHSIWNWTYFQKYKSRNLFEVAWNVIVTFQNERTKTRTHTPKISEVCVPRSRVYVWFELCVPNKIGFHLSNYTENPAKKEKAKRSELQFDQHISVLRTADS